MFTKSIQSCSFVSGQANEAFANRITGPAYNSDLSFLAILRALLSKRIADEDRVEYTSCTFESDSANLAANMDSLLRAMYVNRNAESIDIRIASGGEEERKRFFDRIDDRKELHEVYRELVDIRAYFARSMNVRFFISAELRKTIIIVENLNMRRFHLLCALIPRYIPWFFEEHQVDDFEASLLHSMHDKSHEKFEELIEEAYRRSDIRDLIIRNMIGGFEKRSRQIEIDNVSEQIESTHVNIEDNVRRYQSLIDTLDDLNIRLLGLRSALASTSGSSELVDYFKANKSLVPVNTEGSNIRFIVNTHLDMVDPEMYESIINNNYSYLNESGLIHGEFSDPSDRKLLLDALFSSEPTLRVKVCAYYNLDIRGNVGSMTRYGFPDECKDRIPNPHLHYHNCLGDYRRHITATLNRGNTIGAIEQCIASAKSMNINEEPTARSFMRDLMENYRNTKVIEMPDKTSVTPIEALKWLKEQKEEAANSEH